MNLKNKKGITLIALIITIIVLLILAGIVLMSLSGENGILTRAEETSKKWGSAQEYEREEILTLEAKILEQELELDLETEQEQGSKNEMIAYELDGVPIPKGFTYLEGTRDTGLVIMNKKDKNEFVWVPSDADTLESYNVGNYIYDENLYPESYNLMSSVRKYGGYYIARYCAGADVEITQDGQMEKVYSQSGKYRYNTGTLKQMMDLCGTMYPNDSSNETGVISTYPLIGMSVVYANKDKWFKEELLEVSEWNGYVRLSPTSSVGWLSYMVWKGEIQAISSSMVIDAENIVAIMDRASVWGRETISFRPVLYIKEIS